MGLDRKVDGTPNRRRLLQGAVAAGVLGLTGLPLRAQTRGGTLTAALGGAHSCDTWDSRTHVDLFMMAAAQGAVFDSLTEIAADGSLKGELAESWDSSDAQTWVFNLRRGVTFHNGQAFGPDDVIASLHLHLDDDVPSPARPIVQNIAMMARSGPHQVTFTLTAPNADFPYLLSDYHLLIYPADHMADAMVHGIGTGLYRVETFHPGRRMTALRVTDHYKGDAAGWFDRIDYIAMNDSRARTEALRAGRVDAINRVNVRDTAAVAAHPRLRLQNIPGNQHYGFAMQTRAAPFADVDVRLALKYGIDRQDFVDRFLLGHGQVGNDTPIGRANQFYAADLDQIAYDPDRAAFHRKRAGLDRLAVTLHTSDGAFDGAGHAAAAFADAARPAGIDIDVIDSAPDGYWAQVWPTATFRATHWAGRATEDWMLSTADAADVLWHDGDSNARFQALLLQGRSELDSDIRRDIYAYMQQILRDTGGTIIPAFANHLQGVANRIGTPSQIGNLWQMDDARMAERWWRV
ncbi:ABC transporter substrate-binding protein [Loktanella sp. SALINAS62]|uniref:ABC transporter substrate-binding protein n=1 Tax=Loktanella sp. SALINAS62 TaxID=2706124 RepID=UPI001B8ACD87|nr:ABC transporter substrate-binding protein [Loktanella sp. SALINAS62]MBS1302484.1 ABC transporter substrate-binding protein [Loktanella sp. SALINAS62]